MTIATIFLVFLVALPAAFATDYTVGGSTGWSNSGDYSTWASGKTFAVGDKLVFTYGGAHSVDEVSKSDYDNCNTGSAIQSYSGGSTTVPLTKAGSMYFICPSFGHCSGGMKLAVTVSAASTSPTTPAAPAPAPDAVPTTPASDAPSPSKIIPTTPASDAPSPSKIIPTTPASDAPSPSTTIPTTPSLDTPTPSKTTPTTSSLDTPTSSKTTPTNPASGSPAFLEPNGATGNPFNMNFMAVGAVVVCALMG